MLSVIPTTTANGSSARQIVLNLNVSSVVYTVPVGKIFTGVMTGYSTSAGANINGVAVYATSGTGGFAAGVVPLTLLGGTVVTGLSQNAAIVGVEQ